MVARVLRMMEAGSGVWEEEEGMLSAGPLTPFLAHTLLKPSLVGLGKIYENPNKLESPVLRLDIISLCISSYKKIIKKRCD